MEEVKPKRVLTEAQRLAFLKGREKRMANIEKKKLEQQEMFVEPKSEPEQKPEPEKKARKPRAPKPKPEQKPETPPSPEPEAKAPPSPKKPEPEPIKEDEIVDRIYHQVMKKIKIPKMPKVERQPPVVKSEPESFTPVQTFSWL